MNRIPMEEFMPEYLFLNDKEVVSKIKEQFNMNEMDALGSFLNSKTYSMCANPKMSMWDIGSGDILEMWIVEKITGDPKNVYFLRMEDKHE